MLDIGLCMTVKDEEANIVDCLAPIAGLLAEIVIVDTGSSDRTRELLWERFRIEAVTADLDPGDCCSLSAPRNQGFDRLSTPWLMTLDADERLDAGQLRAVIDQDDAALPAGLFFAWDTDYGDGAIIEDYKLILFRRAHRHRGLVHDTAQPSLRAAGEAACWSPHLRVRHLPDPARTSAKEDSYSWRLACAQSRDPDWLRYHWFSGYMAWRQGRAADAEDLLRRVHEDRPDRFPVESLNASMVLAALHAEKGDRDGARAVLDDAACYHRHVADDFEVRVNFRLGPWIEQATRHAESGNLREIRPYAFPY